MLTSIIRSLVCEFLSIILFLLLILQFLLFYEFANGVEILVGHCLLTPYSLILVILKHFSKQIEGFW